MSWIVVLPLLKWWVGVRSSKIEYLAYKTETKWRMGSDYFRSIWPHPFWRRPFWSFAHLLVNHITSIFLSNCYSYITSYFLLLTSLMKTKVLVTFSWYLLVYIKKHWSIIRSTFLVGWLEYVEKTYLISEKKNTEEWPIF